MSLKCSLTLALIVMLCSPTHTQWPDALEILPDKELNVDMASFKGVDQSTRLIRQYNNEGRVISTDTFNCVEYDELDRRIKYISFENNKRSTIFYTAYPDAQTEMLCSYSALTGNANVKNCSTFEYNERGQKLHVMVGQIHEGKEKLLNESHYTYNDRGQCIGQCTSCQSEYPNRYVFEWNGNLLTKLTQMHKDSTSVVESHVFEYNTDGQVIHYLKSSIWQGQPTLLEEYTYVYSEGQLVSATEQFEFEKGAKRLYRWQYDQEGRVSALHKSIGDRYSETKYAYSEGQLIGTRTTTNFPMITEVSLWFSANARSMGETKTSTIEELWEFDDRGVPIAKNIYIDNLLKHRTELHLHYRE